MKILNTEKYHTMALYFDLTLRKKVEFGTLLYMCSQNGAEK